MRSATTSSEPKKLIAVLATPVNVHCIVAYMLSVQKVQHPVQKVEKVQQLVVQKKATIKQGATTQKKQPQQVMKAKHTQQQQK